MSLEAVLDQIEHDPQLARRISRWQHLSPRPPRYAGFPPGIDPRLVEVLLRQGKAIIICSSYLPEVMGLSDRILVMSDGEITGEVPSSEADEELLLRMASKIPANITIQ